jgi:hypothetical protein
MKKNISIIQYPIMRQPGVRNLLDEREVDAGYRRVNSEGKGFSDFLSSAVKDRKLRDKIDGIK